MHMEYAPEVHMCIVHIAYTLTRNGAGPSRRISITIQYVCKRYSPRDACMCLDANAMVKQQKQPFFMVH